MTIFTCDSDCGTDFLIYIYIYKESSTILLLLVDSVACMLHNNVSNGSQAF